MDYRPKRKNKTIKLIEEPREKENICVHKFGQSRG